MDHSIRFSWRFGLLLVGLTLLMVLLAGCPPRRKPEPLVAMSAAASLEPIAHPQAGPTR
ncbi:MAG TPA: hypothetical protein VFS39_00405 [Nitrospira sp.]|nr:hypothetical protein [Nitrospira sp.]